MKRIVIFLLALFISFSGAAQHPVKMHNLWARPEVHVVFNGYIVSFTIHDINKTLRLLREAGITTWPPDCALDTSLNYSYELYPGLKQQYQFPMQPLLQNDVVAYLLTVGHALILNNKHKIIDNVLADITPRLEGDNMMLASFYDPKTKKMIFQGTIHSCMYGKDIGIDD
ncbi:MAG: hypothetical protein H7257_15235 [Taibaiella sp.]|nr:hypothetical protein [Taibaiella sp.]